MQPSMKPALDRLAAIGASAADQRNAVAVLALANAGFDPRKFANSRCAYALSEELGLDPTAWGRILDLLARAGVR